MSTSTHPIIILSDSDIEDDFSSTNTSDYIPASPDYSPALPGNTSSDPSEDSSKDHELPLERIEHMEDKIEGLGNGRTKQMGHDDVLARVRISTLEMLIEDIQIYVCRGCLSYILYCDDSYVYVFGITMVLLPFGFLEPLCPSIMDMINNQDIEHVIPPTPPRDTEPPIGLPIPLSSSSSVGSSSPVRSTTPPPDYPFDESIFPELDNSLWIIPRPLKSEPVPEEPNESNAC
ncbi:hypothetical protein Tco_0700418 [Tanacetum coccineum]